jgi:PAS domain S-box-containing protein
MAEERDNSSETMRIDLMPDSAHEQASGPASSLTRMDWTRNRKTPEYVARSRYQELLQSLYDAALVTRMTGEIIDVNARAVEFLRYDRGDLFVMTICEIISGTDADLMTTLSQNLENERFSLIQAYCARSDGSYFPAEIAVSRLRLDDVCLCFFIRDIAWREEAESKLRLEHEALQITGNGVIITDANCGIQYANPAFARMLGYNDVEGVLEQDLGELMQNKEQPAG